MTIPSLIYYAQFDELLKMPEGTDMGKSLNEAMSAIEEKKDLSVK